MSRNIADNKLERQAIAQINHLQNQQLTARTVQQQGIQATRLGVVEGYASFIINGLSAEGGVPAPSPTVSTFVDIEAPEGSPILVGSLMHTSFMFFGNVGSGTPMSVENWDFRFGGGFSNQAQETWMTYAGDITNDNANRPYDIPSAQAYRIPDNKVRIGFRYTIGKGSVISSPMLVLYCFYQLRMTLGWSDDT